MRIILDTLVKQGCTNPERIYLVKWHKILVAPQYGISFMLIFRWIEFLCGIYISVKFCNIWFTLFGIELEINVAIIFRFCFLKDTCFFHPEEHSTFTVRITLFSTKSFGWLHRLESVRIKTKLLENCTELYWIVLNCTQFPASI